MKIYRAIKSNHKTQSFGENKPCARTFMGQPVRPYKLVRKVNGVCPINSTEFYPLLGLKGHNGEDWATWHGEPLYFPIDLDIKWIVKNEGDFDGGIGIDVISKEPVELDGKSTYIKMRFWHLLKSNVVDGTEVMFSTLLGFCDNTGASSGDHLHWSLKRCDKNGKSIEITNGYYGAMDFVPWFENKFVLDIVGIKVRNLTIIEHLTKIVFELRQLVRLMKK